MVTAHLVNASPMAIECDFTFNNQKFRAYLYKEARPHPYLDLDVGFTRCCICRENTTVPEYDTTDVELSMDGIILCIEDFTGQLAKME